MLYKEVPYHHVYMLRKHTTTSDLKELEHFKVEAYQEGMMLAWCAIQIESGHVDSMNEAQTVFEQTFINSKLPLDKRLFFIRHDSGEVVGSIALWEDKVQNITLQRLHWLAIKDSYSNQGLANYLISYLCASCEEDLFLSTQTWSYPAIHLYLKHGFEAWNPYMDIDYKEAWKIIETALKQ